MLVVVYLVQQFYYLSLLIILITTIIRIQAKIKKLQKFISTIQPIIGKALIVIFIVEIAAMVNGQVLR